MLLLSIGETFASIGIWIVSGIYKVAAVAFEIFLVLADGTLLSSIDFDTIIKNFYLVIGIVMLFILAFALLKGMVNPDEQKQGTQVVKKVIINLITSAIIMAVLPSIFTFAYDFQKSFIYDNNPIGKFFGYGSLDGSVSNTGGNDSIKKGSYQIVNGVYSAFFNVSTSYCDEMGWSDIKECQDNVEGDSNLTFSDAMLDVEATGDFNLYGNFSKNVDDDEIDFSFLLGLIGGALLIYVAVSFCFDMAVRLVKLAFYQIIAPIPIFFRIIPEGKLSGTFKQWLKITLTCYMEVYTRIFAFYFCIYLCQEMLGAPFFDNLISRGFLVRNLSKAFVLMGIITFMKQAPKLISEVTGIDSGNMKLGIREKLVAGGAFTAGAIVGGGLTAGVRNASNAWQNTFTKGEDGKWHKKEGVRKRDMVWNAASVFAGTTSGAVRGGKSGWGAKSEKDMKASASKGAADAVNARDKRAAYIANHGGNVLGAAGGHVTDAIHSAKEWAGIGVVSSTEADYYTSGANAFDSAHSQIEGTYKGKPGHNKIKERATELDSLKKRLNRQIEDMKNSNPSIASDLSELQNLENFYGPLSKEQTERLEILKKRTEPLRNLTQQYSEASSALADVKLEQSIHEAGEMSKKMSVSMEAINNLVNAKTRYFDISKGIFDDELYNILRDTSGLDRSSSADIQRLVTKIENNETILMSDLRDASGKDIIDLNSLEKFLDQAGIKAKDIAAEKRVEVAHARALKDEKKGDKK